VSPDRHRIDKSAKSETSNYDSAEHIPARGTLGPTGDRREIIRGPFFPPTNDGLVLPPT
jgi:hypothetical protein